MMKKFKRNIFSIILILIPCASFAEFSSTTASFGFGNVIVQRDAPVGTIIAQASTDNLAWAYGSNFKLWYIMAYSSQPSSIDNVYNTNLPGVGIYFDDSTNHETVISSPPPGTIGPANYKDGGGYVLYPGVAKLIKTGKITSGVLPGGLFAKVEERDASTEALESTQEINLTQSIVTQVACSITTPVLTFPLGDIQASKFGTSIGTIPEGASYTKNLGLDCDAGANINVELTGTQNPDSSDNSILALTGQGDNDIASGVGVQILYNDTPLKLNDRIVLKQSAGGQETFPITVHYYQTQNAVKPGKANASATLNLTYQ